MVDVLYLYIEKVPPKQSEEKEEGGVSEWVDGKRYFEQKSTEKG